ncbi:MAG: Metallo-beta-lactamase [Candidatus Woesebacteria bacterium GW2011_GWA1_38_8]|uniref:Metallo-beta-lactamase n=1 Tax=Candidatus Woesebacteria bacterium GW2011_GWA1_38_8 TaxID=1618547 RepID=A0A0G0L8C1_9BACT|nr:MAG: Metallo-beta-lactamase [Candidatus Woesebacteria bacterium GW2011_GWA1_38_8]
MVEICAVGGYDEVGRNCTAVKVGNEVVIFDMGLHLENYIRYTNDEDLVVWDTRELIKVQALPDVSAIDDWKDKVVAIVPTHAHLDHLGGVPFLSNRYNAPIICSPYTAEVLRRIVSDEKLELKNKLKTLSVNGVYQISKNLKLEFVEITHSTPHTVMAFLHTPEGIVLYANDFKFDLYPTLGKKPDFERLKKLGDKGILACIVDSTYAGEHIKMPSESVAKQMLKDVMLGIESKKKAIIVTTFSSHIARLKSIMEFGNKLGRKVVFVGRSIQKKVEAAHRLGYIKYSRDQVISLEQSYDLPRNKVAYIVSGCYGQVGSSLYRIAEGKHERMEVLEGDMVIFSADPAPPYSKESEDYVIDKLIDMGVDVHYYDLNEGLYVSGHGGQEDIVELFNLTRPKYYIPIGGAVRFMHAYRKLVIRNGGEGKDVFILKPGDNVDFKGKSASLGQKISTKEILVHGLGIGDIGKVVLGDRTILGSEGFVVALIKVGKDRKLKGDPEIISRGFVFEKIEKALLRDAEKRLRFQIEKNGKVDKKAAQLEAKKYLEKFFFQKTGRRPMILPIFVEI